MKNYTPISKDEAVAKFGHHFILEISDNRFGYQIVEKLGTYHSIFEDDESMELDEAFGALRAKVMVDSHKTIINNDFVLKSLSGKFEIFFHRKGWLKTEKSKKISRFLEKDELSRNNLELARRLTSNSPFQMCLKPLPEQFLLPSTYFEKDKVYYQFRHSNSVNKKSEVIEVKPLSIETTFDNQNVISMEVSFQTLAGTSVDGSISKHDFKKYNNVENVQPYFETGYSDTFIFMDKDECKEFAIATINKDIEHFQESIKALS